MNTTALFEEMSSTLTKLHQGYETLQQIGKIEVGTTPKTLVWQIEI